MSHPLSQADEQRLLRNVQHLSDALDGSSDLTATDVAEKIAAEHGYGPDMIRLLCRSYNTGATLYQREASKGILDKHASFDLADAETVIERLYSSNTGKRAAAEPLPSERELTRLFESAQAPKVSTEIKRAGDPLPYLYDPAEQALRREQTRLKSAVEDSRNALYRSRSRFYEALSQFGDYFKRASHERDFSYPEVRFAAQHRYGNSGLAALDVVADRNGYTVKTASAPRKAIDWGKAPFSLLQEFLKAASAWSKAQATHKELVQTAQDKIAAAVARLPSVRTELPSESVLSGTDRSKRANAKRADLLATVLASDLVGRSLMGPRKSPDAIRQSALEDLSDPDHDDKLREIETQSLLSNLINNDDVIGGYHPDAVTRGYNELSQLAPSAARQPAVMRPMLRKWLAQGGNVDTFEAGDMAKTERVLQENNSPSRLKMFDPPGDDSSKKG